MLHFIGKITYFCDCFYICAKALNRSHVLKWYIEGMELVFDERTLESSFDLISKSPHNFKLFEAVEFSRISTIHIHSTSQREGIYHHVFYVLECIRRPTSDESSHWSTLKTSETMHDGVCHSVVFCKLVFRDLLCCSTWLPLHVQLNLMGSDAVPKRTQMA